MVKNTGPTPAQRRALVGAGLGGMVARMGILSTSFEGVTLGRDSIRYKRTGGPVAGAIARVEAAADIEKRITATRLLAVGVFAFAWKKKSGSIYLTVEGDGFEFVVEVPVKKEADARQFASKINNAARKG
jgi:hypothetical protein